MPRSSLSRRNSAITSCEECGVERAGRLVGEDELRSVDQRARDRDALLLAARELVRMMLRDCAMPDRVERFERGALRRCARRHAGVDHRQLDVLERARARQQIVGLEHEAQRARRECRRARRRSSVETSLAFEHVGARGGPVEEADDVHEGRLARTRRAHHGHELARLDGEVDAAQRDDVVAALQRVDLAQVADRDDRGHRAPPSVPRLPPPPGRRAAARRPAGCRRSPSASRWCCSSRR